jgi:spore coat polysaccharide biosynthesis protein SpsF
VLSRYYLAAKKFKIDLIIRCNADCPFIDSEIIDKMIKNYKNNIDYYSNILKETFPSGMHIELIKFEALEKAYLNVENSSQKEHVTPYIYNNPKIFNIKNYTSKSKLSNHRWTIDFEEDFTFVEKVFKKMNYRNDFNMEKLLKVIKKNPSLRNINYHIPKKQNLKIK